MAEIEQVRAIVERAKETYVSSLRSAGSLLRTAAQNPDQDTSNAVADLKAFAQDIPSALDEPMPTRVAGEPQEG